jgi:predicted Fe-S protein YdhL (DUF1289 family)
MDLRHPQSRTNVQGKQSLQVKSPCIKVCQMDPARGVCMGCCRTLDEIARWGLMSEPQRESVMSGLGERRKKLDIPEIAVPPLA